MASDKQEGGGTPQVVSVDSCQFPVELCRRKTSPHASFTRVGVSRRGNVDEAAAKRAFIAFRVPAERASRSRQGSRDRQGAKDDRPIPLAVGIHKALNAGFRPKARLGPSAFIGGLGSPRRHHRGTEFTDKGSRKKRNKTNTGLIRFFRTSRTASLPLDGCSWGLRPHTPETFRLGPIPG